MFTRPRGPANGPSGSLRATCCTARLMDPPRVCCWERYPPGRPRKRSWRSYAACWTNIKRGHHDHHCTPGRDAAGQGSRLDPVSLAVGRRAGRAGPAGGAARHALAARALCMRLCSDARRAAFAITFCVLAPQEKGRAAAVAHTIPRAALDDSQASPGMRAQFRMADLPPWLAPFWMLGVLLLQLRSAAGWIAAGRLRRQGVCSAPDPWPQRLDQLRARLRLSKPVALLETCLADVPVVIGYVRPVILVPVGLLAGMPAGQVEAILMHELAHIRRHDYLANLLQTVVESFLFYHPAIWWMKRKLRAESEKCCDDLAGAVSGDAHDD